MEPPEATWKACCIVSATVLEMALVLVIERGRGQWGWGTVGEGITRNQATEALGLDSKWLKASEDFGQRSDMIDLYLGKGSGLLPAFPGWLIQGSSGRFTPQPLPSPDSAGFCQAQKWCSVGKVSPSKTGRLTKCVSYLIFACLLVCVFVLAFTHSLCIHSILEQVLMTSFRKGGF